MAYICGLSVEFIVPQHLLPPPLDIFVEDLRAAIKAAAGLDAADSKEMPLTGSGECVLVFFRLPPPAMGHRKKSIVFYAKRLKDVALS